MSMSKTMWIAGLAAGIALPVFAAGPRYDLGRAATPKEIAGWNIDIAPNGAGLPPGSGTAAQGQPVYEQKCASCHGAQGQGKPMDKLVNGKGTLAAEKPVKTVGSYWPYATTLFDYIRRAMPFNAPQSLTNDEVYAVSAYLLQLNGIIAKDTVMNAHTLPKVTMPNRRGFVSPDPRPDVKNTLCMKNCK